MLLEDYVNMRLVRENINEGDFSYEYPLKRFTLLFIANNILYNNYS